MLDANPPKSKEKIINFGLPRDFIKNKMLAKKNVKETEIPPLPNSIAQGEIEMKIKDKTWARLENILDEETKK